MTKSSYSYLVVEDELEVCKQLQTRMNAFDTWHCLGLIPFYDVALRIIKHDKPDLLFLDYSIRGGNTFSLLDEIYKIENYRPYIIFFTAFQNDNPEIPENAINVHHVNKYLVKPIFEKLTNHLCDYLIEAESWICKSQLQELWIETIQKEKIKISPQNIFCISQSETNSRFKIIHTSDAKEFEVKASWQDCEAIAVKNNIDYCFTNARYTLINKSFISKIQKPFIWLNNNQLKVEVTKDKWPFIDLLKK